MIKYNFIELDLTFVMDPITKMSKSIPPLIGEYSYFYNKSNFNQHFIITNENNTRVGCHFSSSQYLENQPFLTCHGKIKSIDQTISKSNFQD